MDENNEKKMESQFIALISLLANSALQGLGKVINPVTGKVEKNIEAAGMTIEWLRMIKVKTANNLSNEEDRVLSSYISNLQLNYVDELEDERKNTGSGNAESGQNPKTE